MKQSMSRMLPKPYILAPNSDTNEEKGRPIVGIEEDVQVLSQSLMNDDDFGEVIFIVGAQGIGKTTLARQLYKNMVKSLHFNHCIWVAISWELAQEGIILEDILKKTQKGVTFTRDGSKGELEKENKQFLDVFMRSRSLIVFDGLNTSASWKPLRDQLRGVYGESKVVVTIRSRDFEKIGSSWVSTTYNMRTLSDEDGWELLLNNAKLSVPPELEQLGREIVRKCMGLPSSILTVREMLSRRGATQDQWLKALNFVSQELDIHISRETADALPSNLKECLSCLEIFGEDYDIPVRRLITLWVAEELVEKQNTGEILEDLAEKLLMELVQKNLVQVVKWRRNGKVKTCRLNYTLRYNWMSKDNKTNSHISSGSNSKSSFLKNMIGGFLPGEQKNTPRNELSVC